MKRLAYLLGVIVLFATASGAAADWKPAKGPLLTRWAKKITPENVHPEYPRPQMVRERWKNLNGLWDYAICPKDEKQPEKFDGQILVPFPAESALSGVMKPVGADNRLWYRRTFKTPTMDKNGRLLLHFGAVDWHATVSVNGKRVGEHKGGYDPFTFDITDALKPEGEQELIVSVWDPTDKSFQPRGKQVSKPHGIWYTAVTGIWQTVWLEPVPSAYIEKLKITPDVDGGKLKVEVEIGSQLIGGQFVARVEVFEGERSIASADGSAAKAIEVPMKNAKLWSPDHPFLYGVKVTLSQGGDAVSGYFGMRKIEVRKAKDGFNRLFLNNKPLFQFGPLDQGWWPGGLYTAPTDEALRYDLEVTKKLGFNMVRKHVKVEPARWYYHCDKIGLLVWQDMPSGDKYIRGDEPDITRSKESAENFRREYKEIIDFLHDHPCIVVWVPFNEGWGQFETDKILAWTKEYDPTRLVDGPSGWTDRGSGDLHDMHRYPGPGMPKPEAKRAVVLGEFGGLGLPLEGHLWKKRNNWGYRTYKTRAELREHYERLIEKLRPLISDGLAAAIYTQTTDVEIEVNGLMTYDRAEIKFDPQWMAKLHAPLYQPPPVFVRKVVVPTSEKEGREWRYTTTKPADGWQAADFDDSSWRKGKGGFGTEGTPGTVIRTDWNGKDIWMRREFELKETDLPNLKLRVHHDEDAEVYVNGKRAASLTGYTTEYVEVSINEEARKALRRGANTIAVHCRQTGGGQYIDVGFVEVTEKPRD